MLSISDHNRLDRDNDLIQVDTPASVVGGRVVVDRVLNAIEAIDSYCDDDT